MGNNKFLKGILYGAIIGGAVTLFDKEVRKQVCNQGKVWAGELKEIITNPGETVQQIQGQVQSFKNSIQQINEDMKFLAEKAVEMKELGGQAIKTFVEKDMEE